MLIGITRLQWGPHEKMMFVRPCCLPVFVLCRILDDKSNMASRVCSLIEAKIKLAMVVSVIDNEDQSCVYRFLLVTAPSLLLLDLFARSLLRLVWTWKWHLIFGRYFDPIFRDFATQKSLQSQGCSGVCSCRYLWICEHEIRKEWKEQRWAKLQPSWVLEHDYKRTPYISYYLPFHVLLLKKLLFTTKLK